MPLNVSPVGGWPRLSRGGCGGGGGRARSIPGNTAVPAITDRKSRRSIVPDLKMFPPQAPARALLRDELRQQRVTDCNSIYQRLTGFENPKRQEESRFRLSETAQNLFNNRSM